jgi:hypothetical protein
MYAKDANNDAHIKIKSVSIYTYLRLLLLLLLRLLLQLRSWSLISHPRNTTAFYSGRRISQ